MQSLRTASYPSEKPCQIEEGLFIGSVGAALNKDALKRCSITHVLVVARWLLLPFPDDFTYKKIECIKKGSFFECLVGLDPLILDSTDTNLKEHFDDCFAFIDEARRAGGAVLVHCFAGISRSATVVIAYLMMKHQMTLSNAFILVKSKRPQICPNQGFMFQLENFEKSLEVTQNTN